MKMSKLLALALVLLISVGTLAGSTIAWFTDEVTSKGNIIKSGTLDVAMEYKNPKDTNWADASEGAIFSYQNWEPGYTDLKQVKISNAGNLAFKFQLNIIPTVAAVAGETNLADVIEVYVQNGESDNVPTSTSDLHTKTCAGTVSQLMNDPDGAAYGVILPEGKTAAGIPTKEVEMWIALHMKEEAGNEYQNLSVGDGFAVQLLATQHTFEEDSFGTDYDAGATYSEDVWDGTTGANTELKQDEDNAYVISTAEEFALFASKVNSGTNFMNQTVKLANNINLGNREWEPIGESLQTHYFRGTFDGQGYTVSNFTVKRAENAGLFGYLANGGNIKNLTVANATIEANDYAGGVLGRGYTTLDNCHAVNVKVSAMPYWLDAETGFDGGAKAGGVIGQLLEGANNTVINCSAKNVTITAYRDLGGVLGMMHSNNSISNCSSENVTLQYYTITGTYDKGSKPNQNPGLIIGRNDSASTVDNNDIADNQIARIPVSLVSEPAALENILEAGGLAVMEKDMDLGGNTITIPAGKAATLDLNGNTLSGKCTAGQGHLFMVNYGADLTIRDTGSAGKITYAKDSSNTGWAIDLEGTLTLESGTIELTGDDWSIGYAVDVRPNAWGTAYTNPTTFNMKGGKIVSSDGAVRVASSSSDTYEDVSAVFNMSGGEIDAAWDGIFIQQSDAAYDTLTVNLTGGKIASSGLAPIRFYGPIATSVNSGAAKPMTLVVDGCNLVKTEDFDTTRTWYVDGKIVLGGGMTLDTLNQYTSITIK